MRWLLALLLVPVYAFAQESDCNYEGSQREMNVCAITDYQRVFSRYTAAYQEKWRGLPAPERSRFVQESNSWARTVRKQCIRASRESGSDETILFYGCLEQVVDHRITRIQR